MKNIILQKIDLYFEFVFENSKKQNFRYFPNMIVGINLILNNKDIPDIQELMIHKIDEQYNIYNDKYYNEIHKSNFINFLSDFVADIFPLDGWSNYPNIWEREIKDIYIYMHLFDFIKNDQKLEKELKNQIALFNNFYTNNTSDSAGL
ncbi:hypothetical protein [Chryseobacterium takakiae]|uniref:Uncharacterized protein n=1 Tax=Chryseobacterium takakiae TaxID=1302685 RepID=A0A1M4UGG0_9FLAO|nr:hypothetical protein [Chryseobacterium takakiae]SHE55806.1 hypothetical protein SAMN05444408_10294 [Chryseobacterium takakiae]